MILIKIQKKKQIKKLKIKRKKRIKKRKKKNNN